MKFQILSVATVEENVGFRVIGCLSPENDKEKLEYLPQMCESMSDVLDHFSENVQPEVNTYKGIDGVEVKTIFYRAISLPELAFVLGCFNRSLPFKTSVELAPDAKMFPDDIGGIFQFQLQCFKQQNNL